MDWAPPQISATGTPRWKATGIQSCCEFLAQFGDLDLYFCGLTTPRVRVVGPSGGFGPNGKAVTIATFADYDSTTNAGRVAIDLAKGFLANKWP